MINWYKIIKTNRGRSYIFYQKSINKMENKRLKLFLSIKEFAKLYKIPLRSYQRVIAKGQVGIKTASKIVKKILNEQKIMHCSGLSNWKDLDKELAYLNTLKDGRYYER